MSEPCRGTQDVYFSPQVALVDMTMELIVSALWFSHGKTVDDSYKNDCKLIYYPDDNDISQKEKKEWLVLLPR